MSDLGVVDGRGTSSEFPTERCCLEHPDWATLTQHLVAAFAQVDAVRVIEIVRRAREGVDFATLSGSEALVTGEAIVRHQLLLLCGATDDAARLDPEIHDRPPRSKLRAEGG